jgi:hypothetical protein
MAVFTKVPPKSTPIITLLILAKLLRIKPQRTQRNTEVHRIWIEKLYLGSPLCTPVPSVVQKDPAERTHRISRG